MPSASNRVRRISLWEHVYCAGNNPVKWSAHSHWWMWQNTITIRRAVRRLKQNVSLSVFGIIPCVQTAHQAMAHRRTGCLFNVVCLRMPEWIGIPCDKILRLSKTRIVERLKEAHHIRGCRPVAVSAYALHFPAVPVAQLF